MLTVSPVFITGIQRTLPRPQNRLVASFWLVDHAERGLANQETAVVDIY
jgi:hypothetical protein